MNRRVAFIVRQVTFLPPPPPPPPAPTSIIEDRFSVQLIKGGIVTVSVLEVLESATIEATVQIVDSVDKKVANFLVTTTGSGFGGGPTPIGGSLLLTPGPVVKFKTFRLLGAAGGTIDLHSFEGEVTVFIDVNGGAGPVCKGGSLNFSFDALESNGANHMPTVIPVPTGNGVCAPGISAGDVTVGRMTMVGSPSSF
jgi:hypothetical protein